jgi:hypothetical protein
MEDQYGGVENYNEKRIEAEEFYYSIGRIWCPALGRYIIFNRFGFRHLIQKYSGVRAKNEQIRRFALLVCVSSILQQKSMHIIFNERDGGVRFWAFLWEHHGKAMKLIIRQIDNGKMHFFSIF